MTTWTWCRDAISWTYRVPLRPAETPRGGLERCLAHALQLPASFGAITRLELRTEERGDDAFVLAPPFDPARLHEALATPETIRDVLADLELAVRVETGEELALPGAGDLVIRLDEDALADRELEIWFSVKVDIYSPITWGEQRDNHALAAVNGPRLAHALAWLRDGLGARFIGLDAADYRDVDEHGFQALPIPP